MFVKNAQGFSRIIDFEISRNHSSIAYRRRHPSLFPLFIPFLYDATTPKLRVCDTLYWLCYQLIRAGRDRLVGGVFFFFAKWVMRSPRLSLSPWNIHIFRALPFYYSLHIYFGQLFVCLRMSANTLARGEPFFVIRYFYFALHLFPSNCRHNILTTLKILTINWQTLLFHNLKKVFVYTREKILNKISSLKNILK